MQHPTPSNNAVKSKDSEFHPYPIWAPLFWHGMTSSVWWSVLAKHRFRVAPSKLPVATVLSLLFGPITDVLALSQHLIHGRAIRRIKLPCPPLFVVGHWRSGTTLLHELLQLDDRFASPTTFQCFAPWHFLLTEGLINRFGGFLLPEHRPMDNMKAGWSLPQEDEFALMNLGAPTTYLRMAFPKEPVVTMDALVPEMLDPKQLKYWKESLDWFVRALTYHTGKPLILKSPPHTGRVGTLVEMYPGAKFIHIVRDPRKLFPSTVRLWRALGHVQGLQGEPPLASTESFVFESFTRMYDSFESQRHKIPAQDLIEIRYEDLVKCPVSTLERIYEQLKIGEFDHIRTLIQQRQKNDQSYKTNKLELDAETEARVMHAWRYYAQRYGYVAS